MQSGIKSKVILYSLENWQYWLAQVTFFVFCFYCYMASKSTSEKSPSQKPHQITQNNTKGEKYVNFIPLISFISCFGVHRRENIILWGKFYDHVARSLRASTFLGKTEKMGGGSRGRKEQIPLPPPPPLPFFPFSPKWAASRLPSHGSASPCVFTANTVVQRFKPRWWPSSNFCKTSSGDFNNKLC